MLRAPSCLLPAMLALGAGCSSLPENVVTVEARADSPAALEAAGYLLYLLAAGEQSEESYEKGGGSKVHYEGDWWGDGTILRSYGLQVAINTPVVDIVGGIDRHRFDDRDAPEANIGLRKRFPESDSDPDSGSVYVQVLGRRGYRLDTDTGEQNYDGLSLSLGAIAPIDERWFFDISLEYESTFERINIDGENPYLTSLSLNFGFGFSL